MESTVNGRCIPWSCVMVAILGASVLHAQDPGIAEVAPAGGPADSDWSGIRAAYEDARHRAVGGPSGHLARSFAQRWSAEFDGTGFTVTPDGSDWTWGLALASYGRGDDLRPLDEPQRVRAEGRRVSYDWDDTLTEWFVNHDRGLEHGFTVHRPPATASDGPLRLLLTVRGELDPDVDERGRDVRFAHRGGTTALTYSGLTVLDADGTVLPARFELVAHDLVLAVEDGEARYPLTIDPLVQQAYIKASNTGTTDTFGGSMAVSGDTAVVAAPGEDSSATGVDGDQQNDAAPSSGAVYVFVRNGSSWSQQAYLKASNTGSTDFFGFSVAVSGDTIVVGAINEDGDAAGVDGDQGNDGRADSGAAYVFVRNGSTWTQQAYLKASNPTETDRFGWSVAMSGDTIVVGAYREDSSATGVNGDQADDSAVDSGAAYVFVRNGSTWTQQAYLKASNAEEGDGFGRAVAMAGDTIVVGAYLEDSSATGVDGDQADNSATRSGAAYVFVRDGQDWSQEAYLKASNTEPLYSFGETVSISGDTIVVGTPLERSNAVGVDGDQADNSLDFAGAAYVFRRSGSTWSQQAYLKASNTGELDFFGSSVCVRGTRIVIGAAGESSSATGVNGDQSDDGAFRSGAAYLFVRAGSSWTQQAYLKASNTDPEDGFGASVAASTDAILVGASSEQSNATGVGGDQTNNDAHGSAGAAYAFLDCVLLGFETEEDLEQPLANGLRVDAELASIALVSCTGSNAGVAVFDSTPGGINDPSQDPDLLVDTGNLLILQAENFPAVDGVFPVPNDDADGGSIFFHLVGPYEARSIRLVDVDAGDESWAVVLTDAGSRTRTFTVPAGWTGDVTVAGPGHLALDLTTLAPQPGFASVATAMEQPGFDPLATVRIEVLVAGTGGVDDLELCPGDAGEHARAAVAGRNGSGVNPETLTWSSRPVLGGTFTTALDCSATGPGLAILEVRRQATSGTSTLGGELLVSGDLVFRTTSAHAGGTSTLTWAVPHDLALAGTTLHAQALCRAGSPTTLGKRIRVAERLSNALDLVLGF